MIKTILVSSFLVLSASILAQKGPGGVQNTDGTSNLRLWLDADEIEDVVTGNNVSTWNDLSGYGNHVSQTDPNQKPNWFSGVVNGFPYVRFDGGERLEGVFNTGATAPFTMIAVVFFDSLNQPINNPDYVVSFGSANGANTRASIARHSAGANGDQYFTFDGVNENFGPVLTGQQWQILEQNQNSSAPFHSFSLNGTTQVVDDFAVSSLSTSTVFRIGDDGDSPGAAFMLAGKIPEVICFDKILNTAETNIVNSYLSAKYNIAVSNDQYTGDNPGNGDNDRGVIGIGNEANGDNLEAHADGLQITQNTGFENGDYLLAGHNIASNQPNTTDVAGGYAARWERAFWFDITNASTAQTVDITFDFGEGGVGSQPINSTISNYKLVYRAGGVGAWTTVATANSVSAYQITFNGVNLSADGYYTLATLDDATNPIGSIPTASGCHGPGGIGETDGSSNLKLWLNTQALKGGNGDPLVTYKDYSGNDNDATLFNNANIPSISTNVVNGHSAVSFDGTDYIEGNLDINLAADATVISVGYFNNPQGIGDNDYLISVGAGTTANQNLSIGRRRSDVMADANRYYSWTGASAILGPVINTAEWNIFYQEQVTTGGFHNLYMNGISQTVNPNPAVYSSTSSTYRVGMWQGANNSGLDGFSAETIIYNRQLNLAERNILTSYLGAKYGLSVTGDQYTGDDPANGEHDLYVAGIGQESDGTNNCANSDGMIITINTNFQDGDYLMIGISNEANSVNTTDISEPTATITGRWDRVWWADVTNAGPDIRVDVDFDFSDAGNMGFPAGASACYSLLYRSTNSGNWTIITTSTSVSGDQVHFTNVPFVNDGYYTLGTCNLISSPLPIDLLSFDAKPIDGFDIESNKVLCHWTTASELNNDYFTVERSVDGLTFETIGHINGAGVSSSVLNYHMTDETPYSGTSYYRLKQTDFDGSFTYSSVVPVQLYGIEILSIFPNPSVDNVNVTVASSSDTDVHLTITSADGKRILNRKIYISKGVSNIEIPIAHLQAGFYLIQAISGDGIHLSQKQFIKRGQ